MLKETTIKKDEKNINKDKFMETKDKEEMLKNNYKY
jgi:hypothetical protein